LLFPEFYEIHHDFRTVPQLINSPSHVNLSADITPLQVGLYDGFPSKKQKEPLIMKWTVSERSRLNKDEEEVTPVG
jgi:hypothetical protein